MRVHKGGGGRCVNSFHEVLWPRIWRWYELCSMLKPSLSFWEERMRHTVCAFFFFFFLKQRNVWFTTQEGVVLHSQHLFRFYFITAVHFAGEEVCNFQEFLEPLEEKLVKEGGEHFLCSRHLSLFVWQSHEIGYCTGPVLQVRKQAQRNEVIDHN